MLVKILCLELQYIFEVLPIKSKLPLKEQIREICTHSFSVVSMCHDLVQEVEIESLPSRIVEVHNFYKQIVLQVAKLCEDSSVPMNILQIICHFDKKYIELASNFKEFDNE